MFSLLETPEISLLVEIDINMDSIQSTIGRSCYLTFVHHMTGFYMQQNNSVVSLG